MTSPVLQYRVQQPIAEAEASVREALQEEGFGILTEVDVTAVLRARLGIEVRPQKLLGACNPRIANASLEAEPDVGAFLPCGIALREGKDPSETVVTVQNPALLSEAFSSPGLSAPSEEARTRLEAALTRVGTPA